MNEMGRARCLKCEQKTFHVFHDNGHITKMVRNVLDEHEGDPLDAGELMVALHKELEKHHDRRS